MTDSPIFRDHGVHLPVKEVVSEREEEIFLDKEYTSFLIHDNMFVMGERKMSSSIKRSILVMRQRACSSLSIGTLIFELIHMEIKKTILLDRGLSMSLTDILLTCF